MPQLRQLTLGTRFRQPDLGITGVLLMVNDCRARVRIDQPERSVEFADTNGGTRRFVARRYHVTSWAPTVLVESLGKLSVPQWEKLTMAKKKTASTKTTTKKAPAKTAKKTSAAKSTAKAAANGGKQPAAKQTTKKPAAKKTTKKTAETTDRMSALDAAAKVLGEADGPLTSKELIEQMSVKGYWTSPGGKTPHATLYSAMTREMNVKGGRGPLPES